MTMSGADLLTQFQELIAAAEPPELGPGLRSNLKPPAELNRAVAAILGQANLSVPAGALIRALILLWHDHLEEAHTLAQGVEKRALTYVTRARCGEIEPPGSQQTEARGVKRLVA